MSEKRRGEFVTGCDTLAAIYESMYGVGPST